MKTSKQLRGQNQVYRKNRAEILRDKNSSLMLFPEFEQVENFRAHSTCI